MQQHKILHVYTRGDSFDWGGGGFCFLAMLKMFTYYAPVLPILPKIMLVPIIYIIIARKTNVK